MRSGSFRAVGGEGRTSRDPRVALGYAGVIQFTLFGFLVSILHIQSYIQSSAILLTGLLVSLAFAVGSVVIFIGLKIHESPMGTYEVTYVDNRSSGGILQLSFTNTKNQHRTGLVVSKIEAYPDKPIFKKSGQIYFPVEGEKASIVVHFENMKWLNLLLGFASSEEMENVYAQLKASDSHEAHQT